MALEEADRLQPNVTLEMIHSYFLMAPPEFVEHYIDGRRKAGWQDSGRDPIS